MEAIAYTAYSASTDLAEERGPYSTFKGSLWDRGILPHDTMKLLEQERVPAGQVDQRRRRLGVELRVQPAGQGRALPGGRAARPR